MTLDQLTNKHSRLIAEAFRKAMAQIQSEALVGVIVDRLEKGDIRGAIDALQIEPGAFGALEKALQDALGDAGQELINGLPRLRVPNGPAVVWQFSVRNPSAEAWLRERSSTMIQEIVEDQQEAIRGLLVKGMQEGKNPRSVALDIVGRNIGGKRSGGVLGLTSEQIRWQQTYEADLRSGDPSRLRNAIGKKLRHKGFDRTVLKAIRERKSLDETTIRHMVRAYRNRTLKYRGDTIGRTEALAALSAGRQNAIEQQIASGKIAAEDVTKVWDATGDARTRHTHLAMEGQEQPFDGAFQSPAGATLRYPHDPEAPASETIQCRCRLHYKIDHIGAGLRKYQKRTGKTVKPSAGRLPKTHSQAEGYVNRNGIARRASFQGMAIKNMGGAFEAAKEVTERFALKPLDYMGPISRHPDHRISSPKNANAAIYPTIKSFHMPMKFGKLSDYERFHALAVKNAPLYQRQRDANLAKKSLSDDLKSRIQKMKDGEYSWTISDLQGAQNKAKATTYHEYGHVIHLVDDQAQGEINDFLRQYRPRQNGWDGLLSAYSRQDDYEYVAEAFCAYMLGNKFHYRIHPSLLEIFKRYDRQADSV